MRSEINQEQTAQIRRLVQLITKEPKVEEHYLRLANLLIEQGAIDLATELLEKAKFQLGDTNAIKFNLAVCNYLQAQYAASLSVLKELPQDDAVLYQTALNFFKLNQLQKSLAYALSIKQADDKVQELLGDLWLALGNLDSAKKALLQVKQKTSKVCFLLGICYLADNDALANQYFDRSQKLDQEYYQRAKTQFADLLTLVQKGKGN